MRGNELLDKLERIDPAYIEAADTAPTVSKRVCCATAPHAMHGR